MLIRSKIKKLQYDINREAAKISALSSGKINKYEYLTGEEILPSNQKQIIEETKFIYSPLGKAFEKQAKTIEDQGQKQIDALKNLKPYTQELTIKNIIPEYISNDEAKNELNKIRKIEKTVDRENLVYRTGEYTHSFKNFQTIRTFDKDIYNGKINLKEAGDDQSNLLVEIINFLREKQNRMIERKNKKKNIFLKTCMHILRIEKELLMLLKVKYFQ